MPLSIGYSPSENLSYFQGQLKNLSISTSDNIPVMESSLYPNFQASIKHNLEILNS